MLCYSWRKKNKNRNVWFNSRRTFRFIWFLILHLHSLNHSSDSTSIHIRCISSQVHYCVRSHLCFQSISATKLKRTNSNREEKNIYLSIRRKKTNINLCNWWTFINNKHIWRIKFFLLFLLCCVLHMYSNMKCYFSSDF